MGGVRATAGSVFLARGPSEGKANRSIGFVAQLLRH